MRTALAIAVSLAAVAICAPTAAASTFGSDLAVPPSPLTHPFFGDYADCNDFGGHPCTLALVGVHRGNAHPAESPIPGVVVRFRIRSLTTDTITFRILRPVTGEVYRGAGTGPTVSLGGSGAIETYTPVRPIAVARGDVAGFNEPVTPIAQTSNCDLLDAGWFEFSPPLLDGSTGAASASSTCELLVNADVEPDLDRDGLGDDTMDTSVHVGPCGYRQVGTAHRDQIDGFPLGDRIDGLGDDDRLRGLAGVDCLNGGAGRDTLIGGPDRDELSGGGGDDTLRARDGSDSDTVDCGGGREDVAVIDRGDRVSGGCESVRES